MRLGSTCGNPSEKKTGKELGTHAVYKIRKRNTKKKKKKSHCYSYTVDAKELGEF
jgi:hypothetical protein